MAGPHGLIQNLTQQRAHNVRVRSSSALLQQQVHLT